MLYDVGRLSGRVQEICKAENTTLYLSIASLWEIQIKLSLGKLQLEAPLPEILTQQVQENGLTLLSIAPKHIFALQGLPVHHRDPFDRMLIAQTLTEGFTLLSADAVFKHYAVSLIWD